MNKKSRFNQPLFDLKKKFPNYFFVWVFRSALFLIILFTVFVSGSNGWRLSWAYVDCPLSYETSLCTLDDCSFSFVPVDCSISYRATMFSEVEDIVIPAGESWGYKPNFVGEYYLFFVLGILLSAFIINHLIAKRFRK